MEPSGMVFPLSHAREILEHPCTTGSCRYGLTMVPVTFNLIQMLKTPSRKIHLYSFYRSHWWYNLMHPESKWHVKTYKSQWREGKKYWVSYRREETSSELSIVFWFFTWDMHRRDKQTQYIFVILVLPMLKANLVVQIFFLSIYKCLRSDKTVYICSCKQYIDFSFKKMTKFSTVNMFVCKYIYPFIVNLQERRREHI